MKLGKMEAAIRQMETAIELLFEDKDPVSVHTLAMAAFAILKGMARHHAGFTILDALIDAVRPDKQKEFWNHMNRPSNFFKHAGSPHENELDEFYEEANDVIIFSNIVLVRQLGGNPSDHLLAFTVWFMGMHPDLIDEDSPNAVNSAEYRAMAEQAHSILSIQTRSEQLALGRAMLESRLRNK